ncbi:hypothetical protein EJ03DRAFT_348953 [Teratosphaeria nubilosa]|uniref:chitin synthase n=1 Tax=Teratosphaeria nubilosa TaxID=161662 RepID=A0A6G1LGZ2_9PEZI|nr:hypothetical protein EJ03DRAFT_348953 [Teratosphaeria nubilosa]
MSSNPASPRRRESYRESRTSTTHRHSRHRSSQSGTRTEKPRRPSQSGRRPSQSGGRPSSSGVEEPRATHERRERRGSTSRRVSDEAQGRSRRRSSAGQHHQQHHRTTSAPAKDIHVRSVPVPYSGAPSPGAVAHDRDPMLEANRHGKQAGDIRRQKSLVRPERRRQRDPEHDPNYYYRKHAHDMNVFPSTTGNDPQLEDDVDSSSESTALKDSPGPGEKKTTRSRGNTVNTRSGSKRHPNKLSRKATHDARDDEAKQLRKQKIKEASGTPTLWGTYCHLITFWAPNPALRCFGMKQKEQQRAWREKIGLISLILLVMLFVGFLTFGFTETVCPAGGPARLRVNHVGTGYMIFHGQAYDLTRSQHPAAIGIASGANVLWDLAEPEGGKDGSFLFQNVNGACKGLITAANNSDVVTNSDGDLAWYFPCNTFNQDGSSKPNMTIPYYLGYACHTAKLARTDFYDLHSSGDVYFTWDDVRNKSRNLIVYSGDVLDLDLLEWFNTTQVAYPNNFNTIRESAAIRGLDVTKAFATGDNKQTVECFQDIIKVGSIDTLTIGCIASKVVLYVSLGFILGIVVIKFLLALLFQWFLCRKYAAKYTSMSSDKKKRMQQIEDWSEDIYRPPPKMTDPASDAGFSVPRKQRASFLPTTSRFTSPYAIERAVVGGKSKPRPTTMASQHSTARLLPGMTGAYAGANGSDMTLPTYTDRQSDGRPSYLQSSNEYGSGTQYSTAQDTNVAGPQGFIHEAVVPQPPPEWEPFGFPLAHSICLVTAYSEGPEGIRTTLDSIAMTDYPNSHKLILVICDGLIKGKGESMSTPEVCISMMKDHAVLPEEVEAFSYVAVASGSKRHNMAKIYSGFYDYGPDSIIPVEKQQRVPMVTVVKCGTPAEASAAKPGNRGKRDSQIILMSFLQKVMFDERMTELEYEMFNGIWKITGISPDFYEIVLMVDADTKVFPDSLTHMISAMVKDPEIMGLCGETKIANKTQSFTSMIQVFEYFISHHQSKSFESVFGGVTCLPGCFCMYRIKTPKGVQNYWVPILANPDIVEHYSENVVDTLHKKNLLLLGEDRYLSTLMLKTFPKRKQVFVPQAVCKTTVPDSFKVLLSQRRRWINSTVHNLFELVLVRDLCGTFCFSMQFVVFIELVGTLVLPAAIAFTVYLIIKAIIAAVTHTVAPTIPLVLLALILGLPGVLIVITAHRPVYVLWMGIYLCSLPIWNFVLPTYSFWHFDDFSWGDTRQTAGEKKGADKSGHGWDGEFDSSRIVMRRWGEFEQERRVKGGTRSGSPTYLSVGGGRGESGGGYESRGGSRGGYERKMSQLGWEVSEYRDYP